MDENQLESAVAELQEHKPEIKRSDYLRYKVVFMQGLIDNLRGWYPQFQLEEVESPIDNGDGFDSVILKAPANRVIKANLECLTIVQSCELLPNRTSICLELEEECTKTVGEMKSAFIDMLAKHCNYHCTINVSNHGQPVDDDYVPQSGDSLLFDTHEVKNDES